MNKNRFKYFVVFITLFFITTYVPNLQGQDKNSDKEKILRLHQKDLRASREGYVDSLISLWDKDGLLLPSKEPPVSGIEAITKYLSDAHSRRVNIDLLQYDQDFRELNILDSLAFEWGFYKNKVRVKRNKKIVSVKGKLFRVLRKNKDGDWKVYRAIWTTDEIKQK